MIHDTVFIHHSAHVSQDAHIGEGTKVWVNCQIRENATIGKGCIISKDTYIDEGVRIGDNVKIQNGVSVYHGVSIGNDVFVGPNAAFTNDYYPRAQNPDWAVRATVLEDGCSVGANATIVCGHTLGTYCMVGAGSVVTHDVPPYTLVVGNPARAVGRVCRCGRPVQAEACPHCGFVLPGSGEQEQG